MRANFSGFKFFLRPFLGSCMLVGAALLPHAPVRDVLMGFVLAATIGLIVIRR